MQFDIRMEKKCSWILLSIDYMCWKRILTFGEVTLGFLNKFVFLNRSETCLLTRCSGSIFRFSMINESDIMCALMSIEVTNYLLAWTCQLLCARNTFVAISFSWKEVMMIFMLIIFGFLYASFNVSYPIEHVNDRIGRKGSLLNSKSLQCWASGSPSCGL